MGVRSAARGVPVRCVLVTGVIAVMAVVGACGTAEDTSSSAAAAAPTSTTAPASGHDPDDEPPGEPPGFTPVPIAEVGLAVPADCPVPWLPVYAQDEQTYPVSVPPTEVRPSGGTPVPDLTTVRLQAPDSDGDGVADVALEGVDDGAAFALERGDGELILAVAEGSVGAPGGGSRAGDLDGDGRDELLVFVADGSGAADHPLYVVSGAIPAGRHDPRAVGARLPAFAGMPAAPLGDVDGDGNQDLLLPRSADELMVVSGTIIMDALGGAVRDEVAPLVVLPADVRSALLLGEDRTVPVRVRAAEGAPSATELVLMTEPAVVLRTDRLVLSAEAAATGAVTAFDNDDGLHVQLAMPGTRSGTQLVFVWSLDDPCSGPSPTS